MTSNVTIGRPTRLFYLALTFFMLVAALVVLPPHAVVDAAASPDYSGIGSNFEIDGNIAQTNGDGVDWGTPPPNLTDAFEVCATPNADDIIVPSTKLFDPSWPVEENAKAAPKGDLCTAQVAWEMIEGEIFLYFSWSRYSNNGEVSIYIPLQGGPAGYVGDYLLSFDQDSSAKTIGFEVLTWSAGQNNWVDAGIDETGKLHAEIDQTTGKFAEAAVNLTALGLISSVSCDSVVITRLITETGEGVNSDPTLKDNVGFGSIPLANCGRIIVEKDAIGGDDSFEFETSYDDSNFFLSDGQSDNSGLMVPGTYSVAEINVPAGWVLTGSTCSDGSDPSSIALGAGETVTCTFENTKQARIIVQKTTVGGDADFTFSTSYGSDFDLSNGESNNSGWLTPATGYSVSESVPTGWIQTGASCDNGDDPSSIDLDPGDEVTCSFENTKQGTIVVHKTTVGGDGDFTFTPSWGASFDLSNGESSGSGWLDPGDYDVAEIVPAGWDLTSATCTGDGNSPDAISLGAGETVDCYFTNTKRGSITVVKNTDGGDGTFSFSTATLPGGGFDITTVDNSGSKTFPNLVPGGYDVSEIVPDSWVGTANVTCSDGSDSSAITLDPGENVTCTFTNTAKGSVTIVKNTVGGTGEFDFTGDFGDFSLDTSGDSTDSTTFTNVTPGSYSVAESVPAGWDLTSASCTGDQDPSDFTVAAGQSVTCTFENSRKPTLTLEKFVENGDGGTAQPTNWTLSATKSGEGSPAISGDGGATGTVDVGLYDLAESGGPGGYAAGDWDCSQGDGVQNGATVTLGYGDDGYCSIVNDDIAPTLTLVKEVVNDDGGSEEASAWNLTANDGGDGADLSGTTGVSGDVLANAVYTLGETGPEGYSTTGYVCEGEGLISSDADSVVLDLAADVTCTITNDDIGSSITVVKAFEHETNVDPDSFNLTVSYGEGVVAHVMSGETNDFDAGETYTVGETVLEGWTQTGLVCEDEEGPVGHPVELGLDQHVTCTITNGENPTVTVIKQTDLETEDLFDFALNGDEQSVASGDSYTWEMLEPGDYSLVENLTSAEWALEGYDCDTEYEDIETGAAFSLGWGEHVTCVFGNNTTLVDLAVTKVDAEDPINLNPDNPQDEIVYTITVTNNGPADATGVTAVDTLPAEVGEHLTFVSAVSEQGTCDEAGGVITCEIGDMASGASVAITVTLQTWVLEEGVSRPAFVDNEVTVSGDQPDPNEENNFDDERTFITEVFPLPAPEVYILKTDLVDPINLSAENPDGEIEYVLTVGNRETALDPATGVVVTDNLPDTTTFISAVPSKGACAHANGVITCEIGDLAIGETMTINVRVATESFGNLTKLKVLNVAEVTINEVDDLSDNVDDEETSITEVKDLPETGFESDVVAVLALTLTVLGAFLVAVARKENEA